MGTRVNEFAELAKNFGIPAVGAIAGWLFAAAAYKHRLDQIEKDFAAFRADQKEKHKLEQDDLKERFESLERMLLQETAAIRQEVAGRVKELGVEVEAIDKAFTQFERASGHDFAKDAELAHFVEEQQRQWQAIHRTLGQIEGVLRNSRRWTPVPPPLQGHSK